jgi:hypothetical protein
MFSASRLTVRKILRTMPCMSALSDFLSRCQTVGDQAGISQARLGQAARIDTVKSDHPDLIKKLAAGVRLSEREWERLLKAEPFDLSNSQAERAVRINLKNGQGEPDDTANTGLEFLRALRG